MAGQFKLNRAGYSFLYDPSNGDKSIDMVRITFQWLYEIQNFPLAVESYALAAFI